ncbi:MAG: pyridoxamine 5'-phosphate oxidase family protein [Methanomicrobium sp.]|jgi:hypothetical protein|nr:pyridoxamine 5'-phosphate oxidase family protein [Methanomicrobium sp.]MBQ3719121.1 pyridoxamine 5'-phosphate oxidase family protein [Methanomicrobium sp.]MBQ4416046.1 pyridoxamine 5'-phosphate oxidase family protein [Methanomicrobium sp.]
MVKLTADMKETYKKNMEILHAVPLATADKNGLPNVAPMGAVWLEDDETFWICDNFMKKTLANLKENPQAALYFWNPESKRCLQVKCKAEVKTSGDDYKTAHDRMKAKGANYPAKGLIVLHIIDVFECTPGPKAGEKAE